MSETVLAALIAATATILTTLLQLKISLGKEGGPAPRNASSSRKKPKLPAMLLGVMLTAAAVGGFALSQWFTDRERVQQKELRQELQARITEISRTAGELKQTRLDTFAEVEVDVLRRMGGAGIVALATVGACHGTPPSLVATSIGSSVPGASSGSPSASTTNSATAGLSANAPAAPASNTPGAAPRAAASFASLSAISTPAGSSASAPGVGSFASASRPTGGAASATAGGGTAALSSPPVAAGVSAAAVNSAATPSTNAPASTSAALQAGSPANGSASLAANSAAHSMSTGSSESAASPNSQSATPAAAASNTSAPADAAQTAAPAAASCAEAEATPVLLCAPIPSNAVVSHVDLFTRFADGDEPWNESQVAAGQEVGQARFSEKKQESLADDGMKHVCHKFANWSTQHARVARMIVRYAIPAEALEPQPQVRHKAIVGSTGALAVRQVHP